MEDKLASAEAARLLASRRPVQVYTCVVCGQEFSGRSPGRKSKGATTCSDRCRQARFRAQRKAKADPPPAE